jgi:hypothetical protein
MNPGVGGLAPPVLGVVELVAFRVQNPEGAVALKDRVLRCRLGWVVRHS